MGGDKGEGAQTFYHPHLTSPIKGEELCCNPAARCRELSSLAFKDSDDLKNRTQSNVQEARASMRTKGHLLNGSLSPDVSVRMPFTYLAELDGASVNRATYSVGKEKSRLDAISRMRAQ